MDSAIAYAEATPQARKIFCSVVFNPVAQANSAQVRAFIRFKESLEKLSQGALLVKIVWNNSLTPDLGTAQRALMTDRVHVVHVPAASLARSSTALLPLNQLFLFPYPDLSLPLAVVAGPAGDMLRARMLKDSGLRIEAFWELGYRHLSAVDVDLQNVDRLKGQRCRVQANPVHEEGLQRLGLVPVPMPWADVYEALRNKSVAGADITLGDLDEGRLYQMQKSVLLTGHAFEFDCVLTSQKFYNSLTSPQRCWWNKAMAEATLLYRAVFAENAAQWPASLAQKMIVRQVTADERRYLQQKAAPSRLLAAQMSGAAYYAAFMAEVAKVRLQKF